LILLLGVLLGTFLGFWLSLTTLCALGGLLLGVLLLGLTPLRALFVWHAARLDQGLPDLRLGPRLLPQVIKVQVHVLGMPGEFSMAN